MMNRTTLFTYLRRAPFGGRLLQDQVDGVNLIVAEWERRGLTDLRWLAYMLATVFHETAATMQPIAEYGKGKGKTYGKPDSQTGQTYYGRGYVQLTWKANYQKMTQLCGLNLVGQPDLAMRPEVAVKILFEGMLRGVFTGKKLGDYFGIVEDDPVGARRIINGTDKAQLIAGHYRDILGALQAADESTPQPVDVQPVMAQPDDVAASDSKTVMGGVMSFIGGGGGLALFGAINNPYAVAALGLLLVAAGVAAWLYFSGRITINRKKPA